MVLSSLVLLRVLHRSLWVSIQESGERRVLSNIPVLDPPRRPLIESTQLAIIALRLTSNSRF
jgi:hypothetical protein